MFSAFESHFRRDANLSRPQNNISIESSNDLQLKELLLRFAGVSFNNGLYRVMSPDIIVLAKSFVAEAFPSFSNSVVSFAYDWLGRMFALDANRREGNLPAVVMFEPGTAEALEIPCNLLTFHEIELIRYREAALAGDFHKQWLAKNRIMPKYDQCIGYKKPLFLSGQDTVENLELANLDVYWTLCGQLIQSTRGLPTGTRIGKIL
jgi:hypothetical protein